MSSRAATAPVFGSIRAHWTWSRRNPPPRANHRPFGSTASRGPVPGAFHWAFHNFFPPGTSQAVIPVFSDVLYRTVAVRGEHHPLHLVAPLGVRVVPQGYVADDLAGRKVEQPDVLPGPPAGQPLAVGRLSQVVDPAQVRLLELLRPFARRQLPIIDLALMVGDDQVLAVGRDDDGRVGRVPLGQGQLLAGLQLPPLHQVVGGHRVQDRLVRAQGQGRQAPEVVPVAEVRALLVGLQVPAEQPAVAAREIERLVVGRDDHRTRLGLLRVLEGELLLLGRQVVDVDGAGLVYPNEELLVPAEGHLGGRLREAEGPPCRRGRPPRPRWAAPAPG